MFKRILLALALAASFGGAVLACSPAATSSPILTPTTAPAASTAPVESTAPAASDLLASPSAS